MQKKFFALSKSANTFSLCQSKATLPICLFTTSVSVLLNVRLYNICVLLCRCVGMAFIPLRFFHHLYVILHRELYLYLLKEVSCTIKCTKTVVTKCQVCLSYNKIQIQSLLNYCMIMLSKNKDIKKL